ncbi:MAG TPA: metallopeptidase TldD-related protein [Pyrinomonadaceae bacterium]|nr:metallopeptidase TldD-related protein [Pyrinomonadaceae bacterium]
MTTSRRDFIKTAGIAAGAVALPSTLPAFISEVEAVESSAAAGVDKMALADIALGTARSLGVTYADIRINRYRREQIGTREKQVQNVSRSQDFGFGVRVLFKGTWGFASSREVTPAEVRRITRQAVAIARANSVYQRKRITMAPAPKVVASWKSAFEKDPFDVGIDDKIQFLLKLNERAMKTSGVNFVNSSMGFVNEQKFYASTDGSRIDQYIIRANPSFNVTAINRSAGDFQSRTDLAGPQGMGYEYMEKYPWLKEIEQAAEDAVAKLKAKPVEPGKYDLVLHPSHLWLTIHESVGHPTELDRSLWWEANYAGTSFITREKLGKLQFASKIVNFVADRTQPVGLATVGYDDEGVPAQKWHLIKEGVFVDWQTTRDLANMSPNKKSYGCLHADSWGSISFPRMPNVSLQPGTDNRSFDDLVAGVEKGILIHGNGSYSIDQQRYNFQFGGQTFREIKNGKVGGMLRDVAYQSRTTDFWNSCDGLGGPATYEVGGSSNDGKGEPGQSNAVSHGCPVARFRGVNVLNTAAR